MTILNSIYNRKGEENRILRTEERLNENYSKYRMNIFAKKQRKHQTQPRGPLAAPLAKTVKLVVIKALLHHRSRKNILPPVKYLPPYESLPGQGPVFQSSNSSPSFQ